MSSRFFKAKMLRPSTVMLNELRFGFRLSKVLEGKEKLSSAGNRIFEEVISVASGKATKAEKQAQRDFCIFKMSMNI
jgi:altronate dehydratase